MHTYHAVVKVLRPVEKVHTYHTFVKVGGGVLEKMHTYHTVVKVLLKKSPKPTPLSDFLRPSFAASFLPRSFVHTSHAVVKVFLKKCTPTTPLSRS